MKNPKHEIMLVNTVDGIMAHWLKRGNPDPEIVELFGTHIVPTPYITADSMPRAKKEIEKLNPGYVVSCV